MLTKKLIEYLQYSDEAKQTLNPNTKKQYDFQIRKRAYESIEHFKLLISTYPDDQLKKIFTDERIDDLLKITEKAVNVTGWRPKKISIKKSDDEITISMQIS